MKIPRFVKNRRFCYNTEVMKTGRHTVIAASQNKNKIREIREILEAYGMTVISRDEAGMPGDIIEETGETFEENSFLKASAVMDMIRSADGLSAYLKSPVIADDSGLVVDALGGAPGVYSARYAGLDCSYIDNNKKLLSAMKGLPPEERSARFVTVITLVFPDAADAPDEAALHDGRFVMTAKGVCEGRISCEPRGEQGFGYDPLFIPEGYDFTFAELGAGVKNTVSHRAKALAELEKMLGSYALTGNE